MYKSCPLYAVQSKKMIFTILNIHDKQWTKNEFIQQNISPYIDGTVKQRLVEAPSFELKRIQKRIKYCLSKCQFPQYVFSGVKGKSYVDNAKLHSGVNYLYKIDISAFFPNTSREKVYQFYRNELKTSPDVAEILTNLCTSDLSRDITNKDDINAFIVKKKIKQINHLCTGASPSPLLSYLVNKLMFDEMHSLCCKHNITMTIYVDDAVFSCSNQIPQWFRSQITSIVSKYGYNISRKKVKLYAPKDVKKVTGVIIRSDGVLDIPNKLMLKIKQQFASKEHSGISKLHGCVVAARQIKKSAYPSVVEYIRNKKTNQHNWTGD